MQNETLIEGQAPDQTLDPSPADMPADAATEAEAADPSTPQRPKRRRFIDRAKLIKVNDMAELSALIRCLRLRVGFTQAEAADILGVGRRWYNDLENGKETIRAGMIFKVLASFDCSLALVGPGADFTKHDLEKKAVVKGREEHVWEAQMRSSRRLPKTRRRRRGWWTKIRPSSRRLPKRARATSIPRAQRVAGTARATSASRKWSRKTP